jgi:FixJ family two-component response regulator
MRLSTFIVAVVEDDRSMLESLEGLLGAAGYEVLLYLSGEAFLSSGRLQDVNCLITDIGLPGMDGIELLRLIRQRRANLMAIAITACQEPHVRKAALDAGALHVFLKPLESSDLLTAIALTP